MSAQLDTPATGTPETAPSDRGDDPRIVVSDDGLRDQLRRVLIGVVHGQGQLHQTQAATLLKHLDYPHRTRGDVRAAG